MTKARQERILDAVWAAAFGGYLAIHSSDVWDARMVIGAKNTADVARATAKQVLPKAKR